MENERSIEYYVSRLRDVKFEDITSNEYEYNVEILRKLRDNDPDLTTIAFTDTAEDYDDFVVTNNDDLGWLRYLIGRNSKLKQLYIWNWLEGEPDRSKIDAIAQGISLNGSITELFIDTEFGELFVQRLGRFLRSNRKLNHLQISESDIGLETARNLAVMLRGMSLESFQVERLCYDSNSDTFIDEGAVTAEIITSLSKHTELENLCLETCNLDRSACMALGRLASLKELKIIDSAIADEEIALAGDIRCCLESLELSHMSIDIEKEVVALTSGLSGLHSLKKLKLRNSIGDDALQRLVAAIANNTKIEVLDLSENTSITLKGLSSLASLLQSEKCCLRELVLQDMHIGDDGAAVLAEALTGNKSLKRLNFYDSPTSSDHVETGITATGWSVFGRLLCDTSSINNTYLSNHTLHRCDLSSVDSMLSSYDFSFHLSVNTGKYAAMYKILSKHPDFDMKPLFQWQLKFLPLIVAWFGLARDREESRKLDGIVFSLSSMSEKLGRLQRRELSAIYQFVRGLPSMTVASWRNQKSTDTESKKRKLDHF